MVEGENWKIKFVFKVSVLVKQKKKPKTSPTAKH